MIIDKRNLDQERSADYQVYELVGSPEDIGRGMAAKRQALGAPPLESLSPAQVEFALACAEALRREHPAALAEIEATAAAYGRPVDEAYWFLSVGLTEVPERGLVTSRRPRPPQRATEPAAEPGTEFTPGCSTIAVLTRDGPVIGRNYDFFYWANVRHLITTRPLAVDGPTAGPAATGTGATPGAMGVGVQQLLAHTGMYDGLLAGRHDGMNEAGLFASLHGVRSAPPARRRPGLFCVLVVRVILDTCRTTREAVERILALPHLSTYNYLVADAREAFVVETHPERCRVREADGGVLAATNHYSHPDMVGLGRRAARNSVARYRFLLENGGRLATASGSMAPAAAGGAVSGLGDAGKAVAALMRDHGVPVCGHSDGMATFWSAVAQPSGRQALYCLGAPCRNHYDKVVAW